MSDWSNWLPDARPALKRTCGGTTERVPDDRRPPREAMEALACPVIESRESPGRIVPASGGILGRNGGGGVGFGAGRSGMTTRGEDWDKMDEVDGAPAELVPGGGSGGDGGRRTVGGVGANYSDMGF